MDPKLSSDPILHRVLDDMTIVEGNMERERADQILAKERLFSVLENGAPGHRLVAYLTGPGGGDINLSDAAPLGSMLDNIGS